MDICALAAKLTGCLYKDSCKMFTVIAALYYLHPRFTELAVNGKKVVTPLKESSSPSHINAAKGSSVWLHWNYTYIGNGKHDGIITTTYKEQVLGFNSTFQPRTEALAKKIGQNGALRLESPVPAPFTGRVEVISSNSTLVIHDLQYNDSSYQFSSNVNVDIDPGGIVQTNEVLLKPIVSLTITGKPNFVKQPPCTSEVQEGSNLNLEIDMEGNPKPSAEFRWLHLTGSSPTNAPILQLYPFVYSSTYTMNNTDGSYCGGILQTTIKNRFGAVTKSTKLDMMLNLNHPIHLKVRKSAASECVQVNWNKAKSGVCCVKYKGILKDASGNVLHVREGCNIYEIKICSLNVYTSVAEVQLTVSFKNISKTVLERVSGKSSSSPAPSSQRTSQTDNHSSGTSLLHTNPMTFKNRVSNPTDKTTIKDLDFPLIFGLSAAVAVLLYFFFYGIHWYKKLKTASGSLAIRNAYSSNQDVHVNTPA